MSRDWPSGWIFETQKATFAEGDERVLVTFCHGHKRIPVITATPENETNANYNVSVTEVSRTYVKLELSAPAPKDLVINVNACSTL